MSAQKLPRNPDPNKCYVRCVTPDIYEYEEVVILTYHEDDAFLYPHKKRRIMVKPETSGWETTTYEGCESDNPDECQVLCYRTYPAKYITFYAPKNDTIGDPYLDTLYVEYIAEKGGLAAYEEIDCELLSFNVLSIAFPKHSARLTEYDLDIIDERLLTLLQDKPNIRIEVNAHTDSRRSAAVSQELSESRAEAVAGYLISQGINSSRIVIRGYGETRLTNRCADGVDCSEAEHAENERVEFRVMSMER